MSLRKALVMVAGLVQQRQSGDFLDDQNIAPVSETNDNGGSIVIGRVVYKKTNGNVDLAKANALSTSRPYGLVLDASISAAAVGNIQTGGNFTATTGQWDVVTGGSGGLTVGSTYYVDAATAGKLTATAPTTVGQVVAEIGTALSATVMQLRPTSPVLL